MSKPGVSLDEKNLDVEKLAERALKDEGALLELLKGVSPETKNANERYNSFRALIMIGEQSPETLYSRWDFFVGLLKSDCGASKYIAAHVIAGVIEVDKESKFDKIFDDYYSLLNANNVPMAAQVAGLLGKIAKAKPGIRSDITEKLLSIDVSQHNHERKDLIKSYAIESFDEYYEESGDKEKILAFVKGQLHSKSPRAKKAAEKFLKKHDKNTKTN